jgi:hypothetical protein
MTDHELVTVEDVSFEILEEIGDYDYEWHIGALLRGVDGALFFAEASGCSCYDFKETLEPNDIKPVSNWQAAVEMSKESFDEGEVATFAEKLLAADRSSSVT